MASTNKTTNYELSQFVETDKPAWLTDYNGDMRKLDTALKAVSDVADSASGGISSLTDRMTAAEGAITTNANDIDALEARADNLEAQAQSTAGTIANIQTEQTAQNLGIEAATELGYNLARPYDSASTYAIGAYVLFQNTLYKCVTAIATGEAFDPTKWLAIKATDEISAGGYTLPIASASQLGGMKVGNGLSIDPVTGILSALGAEIRSISTTDVIPTSVCRGDLISSFYSSGSPTSSSYTRTIETPLTVNGFYAKMGIMRILSYDWQLTFNSVEMGSKEIARFYTAVNYNGIDLPETQISSPTFSSQTGTQLKREEALLLPSGTNCMLLNTLYNATNNAFTLNKISGRVLFVYIAASS